MLSNATDFEHGQYFFGPAMTEQFYITSLFENYFLSIVLYLQQFCCSSCHSDYAHCKTNPGKCLKACYIATIGTQQYRNPVPTLIRSGVPRDIHSISGCFSHTGG